MSKTKNRESLKRFRERSREIFEHTPIDLLETKEAQQKRIERAKKDYAFFVNYYFPHYAKAPSSKFHIQAAKRIQKNSQAREILMWARGHAKSTHADIMIPLWLKIQDDKSFNVMVLVGKSQDAAITLISDLQAELQNNQRYINDFGSQLKYGSWEEGRFVTLDDKAFFALGRGQSPRGLRYRQYRPDYIIVDDLDDDELVRNPDRVNKTYEWLMTALFGSMAMGRGRFIMVGNLIAKNSVLAKLADNPVFNVHKVNALDSKGQPAWKENYSRKDILKMIETMGYSRSQKELFNNPITEGAIFKQEWLQWIKPKSMSNYKRLIAYCDPSFKNSRTADYKAIMVVGSSGTELHILDAFVRKCSISEMVRWFYDFDEHLPDNAVCDYYMEANFAQDMILDEFDLEGQKRGKLLPIRKDTRKKPDKFARIEAMSPLFERGLIKLNERKKKTPDMQTFIEQLLAFQKGSRTHDDAPDALEGAVYILRQNMRSSKNTYRFKPRPNRHF